MSASRAKFARGGWLEYQWSRTARDLGITFAELDTLSAMYGLGEPLDSLVLKVERAKKHILELEAEYDSFRKDRPYRIDFKTDPETRARIYYLADAKPIPKSFSTILGDALNNLRSCLDHAVYSMVQVGQPNLVKPSDIYFPIVSGTAAEYNARFKRTKAGLRQDAINAIDAVAPYMGGAGEYYCHLAQLNNVDKHRLLLTIWGSFEGHTMLPSQRIWVAEFYEKEPSDFRHSLMAKNPRVQPLKVGDELLTVAERDVEDDMQFLINIAFAEPAVVRGNPVIETLHEMAKMVHHQIFEFDRAGLFR
jgi:hypothetical protein